MRDRRRHRPGTHLRRSQPPRPTAGSPTIRSENVTKLPSGDAEGHALESTFYVDNAVATQTQNGVTNDYYMDPDGRVRETITGAKKLISHYDGSGEAVAWTCEGTEKAEACESGGKWTRNIPGIDGTLTAVENGKGATYETPILQLHDLEGDVVATIKDKTGETKLESTYNPTEFGVPNGGKEPPKFAWLGAGGVEKSLASGVITEGATSYVPQTGRHSKAKRWHPPAYRTAPVPAPPTSSKRNHGSYKAPPARPTKHQDSKQDGNAKSKGSASKVGHAYISWVTPRGYFILVSQRPSGQKGSWVRQMVFGNFLIMSDFSRILPRTRPML